MTVSPPHGRRILSALFVVLLASGTSPGAEVRSGFAARITQTDVDVTTAMPVAAFALPAGASIHPEAREHGWTIVLRGLVRVDLAGRYRFGVEGDGGEATLVARLPGGRDLGRATAPRQRGNAGFCNFVTLDAGADVLLEVTYKRSVRGEAMLRTLWEMDNSESGGFRPEPIPSSAVRVPDDALAAVEGGLQDRQGRVLLYTKGCTNCHADDGSIGRRRAPLLDQIGARTAQGWLARWIGEPGRVRRHADMPRLFGTDELALSADIAAWLAEQGTPAAAGEGDAARTRRGRELFHTIGCIACHGAQESAAAVYGDPQLPAEVPEAAVAHPYGDLAGKWTTPALTAFLRDPLATHPDGRMPSFRLAADEAAALATYLIGRFGTDPAAVPSGDAERGRTAYMERSCAACHELGGAPPAEPAARPLTKIDPVRGCLDPRDLATPRYDLSNAERALLGRGIEAARRAASIGAASDAPIDRCDRVLAAQNCHACHAQDGSGGPAESLRVFFVALDDRVDLGDEGRIPPDLSSVGFKLNRDWLHRVLTDGGAARPYMGARMPQFGAAAVDTLADLLARRDGIVPGSDVHEPVSTDEFTQAGRLLVGQDAMNCISCHQFKDYAPAGTPGPFLDQFAQRLRYEWWRSYIQAPARFKPGTRMPAFSIGRLSHFSNVLAGDIYRQGDALWSYFNLGEFMPVPKGLEPSSAMKIDVGATPVVLRTFLQNTGPRGIAVGTPEGIHYAFDAGAVRLVEAWRGDFLDASGAWAGRGGSVSGALGKRVWTAPAGNALHLGAAPDAWPVLTGRDAQHRFRGYHLDQPGYPTFEYDLGTAHVEERIVTHLAPTMGLRRVFSVTGVSGDLWFNAGADSAALIDVRNATATRNERPSGEVWYQLRPEQNATVIGFSLEVTL